MPTSALPKLRNGLSLERRRADLAERRMTASLVVERLDVVEELHLRFAEAGKPIRQLAGLPRQALLQDAIAPPPVGSLVMRMRGCVATSVSGGW